MAAQLAHFVDRSESHEREEWLQPGEAKCRPTLLVRLLKAQNGSNPEKNGTMTILVSLEAEFFVERHIQNPLKSAPGKSC